MCKKGIIVILLVLLSYPLESIKVMLQWRLKIESPLQKYLIKSVLIKDSLKTIVKDFIPFIEQEITYRDSFALSNTKIAYCFLALSLSEGSLQSKQGAIAFQSILVKKGNNPFGIKGGKKGISVKTKEYINGNYIAINDKFAQFEKLGDAIAHLSHLLATNSRYKKVRKAITEEAFLEELQKAGYATSPDWFYKFTIPMMKKIRKNDVRKKSFTWTVVY